MVRLKCIHEQLSVYANQYKSRSPQKTANAIEGVNQ